MSDVIRDSCCICLEENLAQHAPGSKALNCMMMTCCGTLICKKCYGLMGEENAKTGKEFLCPICRSPDAKSNQELLARYLKHANKGRAWALRQLGQCYEDGRGVNKSFKKAFEYFLLAADKGDAHAQNTVGVMYISGEGVKQSFKKAFHYFMLSDQQGLPDAQYNVGNCYCRGEGVGKSLDKAFEWFLKAAENGQPDAQLNLADMYYKGVGIEQNKEKAVYYYTKAAEQDNKEAQYNLAIMYANGQGIQQNKEKALYYFTRAAEQDDKNAQFHLALMYAGIEGEGVPMNHVKSIYWLRRYIKDNENLEGCKGAKEIVEILRKSVSNHCGTCGKEGIKLTQCGKCYSIYYCSRECQGEDWKEGKHKEDCKKVM